MLHFPCVPTLWYLTLVLFLPHFKGRHLWLWLANASLIVDYHGDAVKAEVGVTWLNTVLMAIRICKVK